VKFVDVPPEAAKDGMLKSGIPAPYVEALLDLLAAMKAGKADAVTDTVEKVTGRKAGTFEAWARRHAAAFR
jgi:(4-alkanoyl-5-oxo-2,5-dihydrofuran-3-yl)methyl phosphate reductase